jgi:hypothetical protein
VKIIAHPTLQPTPRREWDWCAYIDGHEESGPVGYGKTEQEAVEDLQAWLEPAQFSPNDQESPF